MKTVSGAKLDESHVVWQAVRFIYEGNSDATVAKILGERYGFKVSIPTVGEFRHQFYDRRLKELLEFSDKFQKQQSGRVKSFIDESLEHAKAIKDRVLDIEKQIAVLDKEIAFCAKFDNIFKNAIDKFVDLFDPSNPKEFLQSASSEEEIKLSAAVQSMGNAKEALYEYVVSHNPNNFLKLRVQLVESLIEARESVVKIHKDVFRSYRNFSILQELVQVFEEYNNIIIEEFFSDKKNVDKEKYVRVKQRVFALYDRLQVKYQGADSPSDKEVVIETTPKTVKEPKKVVDPNAPKRGRGRPRTVIMEHRKITIEGGEDHPLSESEVQDIVADIEKEQEERGNADEVSVLQIQEASATATTKGATDAVDAPKPLEKIEPQESDVLSLNPTKDQQPVISNPLAPQPEFQPNESKSV